MYYVFDTDITYYRSQFNSAQLEGVDLSDYKLPWISDTSLCDRVPLLFFSFNPKLPKLDNLVARSEFSLYSLCDY